MTFGESIGLAFQVADDILDVTAAAADLGKTPGKDAANGKLTWVAVHGLEAARTQADARAPKQTRPYTAWGPPLAILKRSRGLSSTAVGEMQRDAVRSRKRDFTNRIAAGSLSRGRDRHAPSHVVPPCHAARHCFPACMSGMSGKLGLVRSLVCALAACGLVVNWHSQQLAER